MQRVQRVKRGCRGSRGCREGAEGAEVEYLREACRDLSREVTPQPVALAKRVAQLEPSRRPLHQPPPVRAAAAAAAVAAATRCHTGELMRRHPERRVTDHAQAAWREGRRRRRALELPRRHVDFGARGAVNLVGGDRTGWGDEARSGGRGEDSSWGEGDDGGLEPGGLEPRAKAAADLDVVDLDLLGLVAAARRAGRGHDAATAAAAAAP